jgi:hypothetical protein
MSGFLTSDSAVDVAHDPFGANASRPSAGQAFEQALQRIAVSGVLTGDPPSASPEVRRAATWCNRQPLVILPVHPTQ